MVVIAVLVLVAACTALTAAAPSPAGDRSGSEQTATPMAEPVVHPLDIARRNHAVLDSRVAAPLDSPAASEPRAVPSAFEAPRSPCVLDRHLPPFGQLDVCVAAFADHAGWVHRAGADRALLPASNQKIFTAIGAFGLLDRDHRFVTEIRLDPTTGDLYVVAGGDPTLTRRQLDDLARRVRSSGVRTAPRLIVDRSRFSPLRAAPGWQEWQVPTYVGPLSTLIVDDNRHRTDTAFIDDPDRGNAELVAQALRGVGVRIGGAVDVGVVPSGAETVATIESVERQQLVADMMLSSDNEIADSLVREIGYRTTGIGHPTIGLDAIADYVEAGLGVEIDGVDGDGSGLSRANLRSAREWVDLLRMSRRAPWFSTFIATFPLAAESGTLAARLTDRATAGNVRAKTGTIIGGRALSGYLTTDGGDSVIFSVIVNGETAHEALGAIDDYVVALAELSHEQLIDCAVAADRGSP